MSTGSEVIAEPLLLDAEERLDARDLRAAVKGFNAAEWLGASADRCAAGRWMSWMLLGEFESAWRESDSIRRRGAPDPHRFWKGEDLHGKRMIVRCLHGFGDAVQFLRYAPALRSLASEVVYEVAPRFVELARCFNGVDQVITWGDRAPSTPPAWDVQIEVMELPYLFRTRMQDLPVAGHYLRLPADVVARVGRQMGRSHRPRVGVVWSAGEWNHSRCLSVGELAPILESDEVEFWNLQGPDSEPAGASLKGFTLRETEECRSSILTLAAVIAQLDLVITVDTLSAHVAGALGIPAWVMLQHAADWRWGTGTTRSPWYPSLRLFRQPRQGDWSAVVDDVRRTLRQWIFESRARLAS